MCFLEISSYFNTIKIVRAVRLKRSKMENSYKQHSLNQRSTARSGKVEGRSS